MSKKKRYLLIVNPEAGSRRTMQALPDIDRILRQREIDFEFHFTDEPGHATELVRDYKNRFDVVVSVGGDGTINEVINGLPDLVIPFGMIPIGTGNDFARSCSIPHDSVEKAIDILLQHDVKTIDVGEVNGRRFVNVMGLGFEGRANEVGRAVEFIKGAPRYLVAIGYTYLSYRRLPIRISFNNLVLDDDVFLLSIGNGWNVGGGLQLTPKAKLDDGVFDICYIKNISRPRILAVFGRLYDGTIDTVTEVDSYQTSHLTIESEARLPIHIDGEKLEYEGNKLEIKVIPACQPVIGNWSADKRFDA
ncbi:MAG: diacylglycerol kinase family protein [Candidatus Neomarinimicrobiota bacterium]